MKISSMKTRQIRMRSRMWEKIPESNRSEWVRIAIRQRLARDENEVTDNNINALNQSSKQLLKVGINLNQVTELLHSQKVDVKALPIAELIRVIRVCINDIQKIKKLYLND